MTTKQQFGIGAVPIITAIAAAVVLGFVGYKVFNAQANKPTATNGDTSHTQTSPASSQSSSTLTTHSSNWKEYKSTSEGFTVKYPADWQLKVIPYDAKTPDVKESAIFIGPNNFELSYDVYKTAGGSYPNCSNCTFNGVTEPKNTGYQQPLYVVTDSNIINDDQPVQELSISAYNNSSAQPIKSWPYYPSASNPDYVVRWQGNYATNRNSQMGETPIYSSYEDFAKKPEVATAKEILASITYR